MESDDVYATKCAACRHRIYTLCRRANSVSTELRQEPNWVAKGWLRKAPNWVSMDWVLREPPNWVAMVWVLREPRNFVAMVWVLGVQ